MNVIVVGAGISGLSAAISLRRCGHKVTIYERSSLNNEVGAAINVPPNAGRFLLRWGLDPAKYGFNTSTGVYFMSPALDELNYHDQTDTEDRYGAPLFYAHRVDLHACLKNMATELDGLGHPVNVHLKSGVSSYNPETPSITLVDGTIITSDLVIAADGVHSRAAEVILGKMEAPQKPANRMNCAYRFLIPRADVEADSEIRSFNHGHQQLGCRALIDGPNQRRLITYSCRDFKIHNFVGICYKEEMLSDKEEDWHAAVDKSEVLETFAGYHPTILAVLKKATEVKRWPLLYRPPISTWYKERLVLAGDAAHPMLPHHAQGGAQGLEDGLALGLVCAGLKSSSSLSEISSRLAIYEKIRRNRAASIQIMSNFGFDEQASDELSIYLEGNPPPTNMHEMIELAYGHDVVERTVEAMKQVDPAFKIPDGFFPNYEVK